MPLSIKNTNKLIQYLKENKDVFEVLFFGIDCESFSIEPKLYFKNYHDLMYQTHWLFENWCDNNKPTGILGESVVFMEEDGVMVEYCKELQNLPYIFLSFRGVHKDNEKEIVDYKNFIFNCYQLDFLVILIKYETWCSQNEIPLTFSAVATEDFSVGLGQQWKLNPYYISPDELVFDESEVAKDITVKTLELINQ